MSRKITDTTRAAARRRKKARDRRNGVVHRPTAKRTLNKVPAGTITRPTRGIAQIARAIVPVQAPVIDPLANSVELPIEDLNLGLRAYNALKRGGINTVGELIGRTKADLLLIRNVGERSIDLDIIPKLAAYDSRLKLKDDSIPALAA